MEKTEIIIKSLDEIRDKESFVETGRIFPASVFMNQTHNADEHLHFDCTDVVLYAGGSYIQILKSKGFMFDSDIYVKLELAEDVLWEKISNNL